MQTTTLKGYGSGPCANLSRPMPWLSSPRLRRRGCIFPTCRHSLPTSCRKCSPAIFIGLVLGVLYDRT